MSGCIETDYFLSIYFWLVIFYDTFTRRHVPYENIFIWHWKYVALKDYLTKGIYEPPHGKTNNLHRRKQRRRSASR